MNRGTEHIMGILIMDADVTPADKPTPNTKEVTVKDIPITTGICSERDDVDRKLRGYFVLVELGTL